MGMETQGSSSPLRSKPQQRRPAPHASDKLEQRLGSSCLSNSMAVLFVKYVVTAGSGGEDCSHEKHCQEFSADHFSSSVSAAGSRAFFGQTDRRIGFCGRWCLCTGVRAGCLFSPLDPKPDASLPTLGWREPKCMAWSGSFSIRSGKVARWRLSSAAAEGVCGDSPGIGFIPCHTISTHLQGRVREPKGPSSCPSRRTCLAVDGSCPVDETPARNPPGP